KAPPTNAFFNISSQQAEFNGVTGAAAWRRDVLATDGEAFSVKAGSLEFNIASLTNAVREFIARDRVEIASRTETGSANASG
ncbi:MAG TPA: hypothetical protein DCY13_00750, partial [Verrucomicrobiales bacterium]|nr:hypothetical protein [Verrucomicrobiales bacterium]